MKASVENYTSFKKDIGTSVVSNSNTKEYNRYMKQKCILEQKKQQESDRIKNLEQQVQQLMQLLNK